MPDVRTPDLVCSSHEFHKIVEEIVTGALTENPGVTRDYLRTSVIQAMLMMAVPAGSC